MSFAVSIVVSGGAGGTRTPSASGTGFTIRLGYQSPDRSVVISLGVTMPSLLCDLPKRKNRPRLRAWGGLIVKQHVLRSRETALRRLRRAIDELLGPQITARRAHDAPSIAAHGEQPLGCRFRGAMPFGSHLCLTLAAHPGAVKPGWPIFSRTAPSS